ncbi:MULTISPECIES: UpxY family transcription antiterminator [Niastella]|uniref:UpxY family transcription antiterminator n=1 Tax=Niastella soli TaxID=2821487 RepID=A0ABS3Z5S7_9BACT|nr:UpxY family transcription antiterminator [Niastella soli]MBO9205489.1 UpxY family transcription antiterminator [Niastella soli]
MMDQLSSGWYVLYTKPRHEKKVVHELSGLKVISYLPMVKRLRAWSDRKKYVAMPLFPSYVFVNIESHENYYSSLEIEGVLYYVRNGKAIARVNESIIESIQMLVSHDDNNIEISSEYFQPGRKLNIKDGPFTGFCCEVINYKGKQKVLVRIELLQRNILFDIPAAYLMPAAVLK